ncbi:MAG TPA: hypothetical protein VGQ18_05055 [Gemmatimonadales bacterium]|nr:hypothetical protein [Gemmatimonadales bacterium]
MSVRLLATTKRDARRIRGTVNFGATALAEQQSSPSPLARRSGRSAALRRDRMTDSSLMV